MLTSCAFRFRKTLKQLLEELDDKMPGLEKIYDGDEVVGAMCDFEQAALLATRLALEVERYHEHFVMAWDPRLPPGHIRIILAHGLDGLPLNKRTEAIEGRSVCARVHVLPLPPPSHPPVRHSLN